MLVGDLLAVAGVVALMATSDLAGTGAYPAITLAFALCGTSAVFAVVDRQRRAVRCLTTRLTQQALHDELTGLLNRRGLLEAVRAADLTRGDVGVLCLDLDGFKRVNDELGHAAATRCWSTSRGVSPWRPASGPWSPARAATSSWPCSSRTGRTWLGWGSA